MIGSGPAVATIGQNPVGHVAGAAPVGGTPYPGGTWQPAKAQYGSLAASATLSGPTSATIYAKSNDTNPLLIGKLYDVAPDGSQTEITRGAMLGSQRELDKSKTWYDTKGVLMWPWQTLTHDHYLVPGKIYRFDMLLTARQWGSCRTIDSALNSRRRLPWTSAPVKAFRSKAPRMSAASRSAAEDRARRRLLDSDRGQDTVYPEPAALPFRVLPEVRAEVLQEGWNIGSPAHWNLPCRSTGQTDRQTHGRG